MKVGTFFAEELTEDLDRLDRSVEMLKYSLQRCREIGVKEDYSLEELIDLRALLRGLPERAIFIRRK